MRFTLALLAAPALFGQSMTFEEYQPKSSLVVPEHPVTRAKFPFIDVHGHPRGMMTPEKFDQFVKELDTLNMRGMVNLDGRWGDKLKQTVDLIRSKYPGRFVVFANLDFTNIDSHDWTKKAVRQLEDDVKNGASGLKIYKNLGMDLKDSRGNRVRTDDSRFDPVWSACGRLKIPVLIHTGEPRQFFDPADKTNERWLELKEIPSRARPRDRYPSWETVMGEQHRVFEKHKGTTFINAHLGWLGGDLGELGRMLDRMPNVNTEIGAVLAELGRQPRFARQWFIRYQDRVLFGKDSYNPVEYHTYFRVLETSDEYFDYYRRRHAFWKMYGLDLPDEVLKKLYYKNALRIVPGFDPKLFVTKP
ncbi:MAG TPA: amidohydrolase family protein [Bryobacteraceae bacterium]|nr:amidohydrolase family protein [Bryobacteraceae bacterium]